MKDYNSLSPKGKFIRSCIASVIFLAILAGFWIFVATHFKLGTGFLVKAGIGSAIVVILCIWQIITTYAAWKQDEKY